MFVLSDPFITLNKDNKTGTLCSPFYNIHISSSPKMKRQKQQCRMNFTQGSSKQWGGSPWLCCIDNVQGLFCFGGDAALTEADVCDIERISLICLFVKSVWREIISKSFPALKWQKNSLVMKNQRSNCRAESVTTTETMQILWGLPMRSQMLSPECKAFHTVNAAICSF